MADFHSKLIIKAIVQNSINEDIAEMRALRGYQESIQEAGPSANNNIEESSQSLEKISNNDLSSQESSSIFLQIVSSK